MRFLPRHWNLSSSRSWTVDVGDEAARTSTTAVSSLAVVDAARGTCAIHAVSVGRCYDDLEVVCDGFCGAGNPAHAWLLIAPGGSAKPGALRAEGWRAVELADWLRRVGAQPLGPWSVLGLRALPPAPHDAAEVVDDVDIEIVHYPTECEGALA